MIVIPSSMEMRQHSCGVCMCVRDVCLVLDNCENCWIEVHITVRSPLQNNSNHTTVSTEGMV